jgi:hypothetical protein
VKLGIHVEPSDLEVGRWSPASRLPNASGITELSTELSPRVGARAPASAHPVAGLQKNQISANVKLTDAELGRCRRQSVSRCALQKADPAVARVTDIATEHGFGS